MLSFRNYCNHVISLPAGGRLASPAHNQLRHAHRLEHKQTVLYRFDTLPPLQQQSGCRGKAAGYCCCCCCSCTLLTALLMDRPHTPVAGAPAATGAAAQPATHLQLACSHAHGVVKSLGSMLALVTTKQYDCCHELQGLGSTQVQNASNHPAGARLLHASGQPQRPGPMWVESHAATWS